MIERTAFAYGLKLLELQMVCTNESDYANPIEPSGSGGQTIAHAIASAIGARSSGARSHVFY